MKKFYFLFAILLLLESCISRRMDRYYSLYPARDKKNHFGCKISGHKKPIGYRRFSWFGRYY